MSTKSYLLFTSVIFFLIAVGHAFRAIYGWGVAVNGIVIPLSVSWIGVILGLVLAYHGIKLRR
ncbi:MAG: hypothetical protein Q7S15_00465 [bacterium]|nr:hypothetical protein [bacterium]